MALSSPTETSDNAQPPSLPTFVRFPLAPPPPASPLPPSPRLHTPALADGTAAEQDLKRVDFCELDGT